MSWFDRLFGESSKEREISHKQIEEDDVYRRPRGKFRFPVNVDNIKTAEQSHLNGDNSEHIEHGERGAYREPVQSQRATYFDSVNTEDLRTSFNTDYVPRRERRRNRDFSSDFSMQSETTDNGYSKRHDTIYQSHQGKSSSKPQRENYQYSEKQFNVHQPKFKASVVPSAIYGTKPRKDPSTLKQPEIPQLKGKQPDDSRPATPTHRKEDNTVNIENVYASQIVAEIRREREKKLQRKKQFEMEREKIRLQQEEITSMMNEEHSDVEYVHVEEDNITTDDRVTIMEHEPVAQDNETETIDNERIENIDCIDNDNNDTEQHEVIELHEGDSITYSTKSPLHDTEENIQLLSDDEIDDLESNNDTHEQILENNDDTSDTSYLEENVEFEQPDDEVTDIEFTDVSFDEPLQNDDEVIAGNKKSLEPTLMPDVNSEGDAETHDIESAGDAVGSFEGNVADNIGSSHFVQVENNELKANIKDHASFEPVLSPKPEQKKRKVSPFNVVMTPSDKRKLLDKKRAVSAVAKKSIAQEQHLTPETRQTGIQETEQAIQQSFEQSGPASQDTSVKRESKRIGPKYLLPPVALLNPEVKLEHDATWVEAQKAQLDDAFYHFNVPAKVENVVVGPSVTRFELSVEKGVKVSRITNLQDDIKMALAAKDIRIEAPIPGTSLVGVEVPNVETRNVNLSEVLFSKKMKFAESKLTVALGARINNEPMIMDLAKMPHGLIAGATGSGKSVCINSILVSLLYRNNPNELKLLLIDPKMVELAPYNDLPHLIAPVITDVKAATESLKWVVEEMERRYKIFADIHVRNISAYNQKVSYVERLPKIVIVIDELADLMMVSPQDVEHAIARIAQKARAAGIHMILATQRPSVNVITGLIKANVPTRIAFMVSSAVDSRTIIDSGGAEKLLGNGDMLYLGNGMNKPVRIQGNYVSDAEIDAVVQYVKSQGEPNYLFQEKELLKKVSESPKDELFDEICDFMIEEGHISTSQIQRRFQIGYNRAARIIDSLEEMGYVSGQNGSKPRTVLITEKQVDY